jgi:hypothetical protein
MKTILTLTLFTLLSVSAFSQNFPTLFSGKSLNGLTTLPPQEYNLSKSTGGNDFDTLHLFLQAGSESTLDSVRCAVYVRVKTMNRWSTGLYVDSLTAAGVINLKYDTLFISAYGGAAQLMKTDSLKASWFSGTSIAAGLIRNLVLAKNDWVFQIYIVGKQPMIPTLNGNAPSTGGTFTATQLKW